MKRWLFTRYASLDRPTLSQPGISTPILGSGSVGTAPVVITDPDTEQDHQVNVDPKYAKKDWYDTKLSKPCPLDHGDHELGSCASFFSVSPRGRIDALKFTICWTCLDPLSRCRTVSRLSKCGNEKKFIRMICAECHVKQGGKNQSGTNMLLCTDPTPKKLVRIDWLN